MSDAAKNDEPTLHVFDQTNGILKPEGHSASSGDGDDDIRRTGQNLAGVNFFGQ